MSREPHVLAVTPGGPYEPSTFSGITEHLLSALARQGARVDAVDGSPPHLADLAARAFAAHPDRPLWRERWQLSAINRAAASLVGARRGRAAAPAPDVLLQIGAWYDLRRTPGAPKPRLRASYHDGNLAVYLKRPDSILDPRSRRVRRMLDFERRVYDGLDLILPMSEWLRRSFIEDFGQDPDKVVAVGGGANFTTVPDVPPGRDFSRVRALFVGKDFARKGGPEVLEAFRALRAERPDAELWIVGPPSAPPPQEGVTWFPPISRSTPGGSEQLARLYEEATLFVLPSRFEPFGIVFLEAMAYGLPCLGADVCAMPEIIGPGEAGDVAPPRDAAALAERLIAMTADPARLEAMGRAARERFDARWTWDHVAKRTIQLFVERGSGRP